jgi:tRNA/rRNA methyltransferase
MYNILGGEKINYLKVSCHYTRRVLSEKQYLKFWEIIMNNNEWNNSKPSIILIGPQMGENIGASARAMLNFGIENMSIVSPRDGWPNARAKSMAAGAGRVLDTVQLFDKTSDALKNLNFVFATTARTRDLSKEVMSPERAMMYARALTQKGKKVGFMFGPESSGLSNEDIAQANVLVSVPVNPEFSSLNLSQCVLLLAYEWQRQTIEIPHEIMALAGTEFASINEVQKLVDRSEEALQARNFFWPKNKSESMLLSFRNMFSRLKLTKMDVQILHGIFKAMEKSRND